MKSILFILILSPIYSLFSQNINFSESPYIEILGKADTLITPNKISVSIKISEKDSNNKLSIEQMESQLFSILKSIGINISTDLEVSDLTSDFKNQLFRNKEIVKEKSYTLAISNVKLLGLVAQKLEEKNIATIRISKVELSNQKEIQDLLDQKAVLNAKLKADKLLKILDQKRGPALHVYANDQMLYAARGVKFDQEIITSDQTEDVNFSKIQLVSSYKILFKIL